MNARSATIDNKQQLTVNHFFTHAEGEALLDRRELLKSALAGTAALSFPSLLRGQAARIAILDGGGTNIVACSAADGLVLVDSGAPKSGDKVLAALSGKVTTL